MKISFISHFPPETGGISTYSERTAQEFRRQKQTVDTINCGSVQGYIKIYNRLTKFEPDIIRLDYSISMYGLFSIILYLILLFYKFKHKVSLVVNFHEVKRDTDLLKILGNIYYYFFSLIFDRVFVHTNEAKLILIERCKLRVDKVEVIPLGLFTFDNLEDRFNELNEYYKFSSKKIILYFGYIHIDKGLEYLIEGYNKLLATNKTYYENTQIVIAGAVRSRKGFFKFFENKDNQYLKSLKDNVKKNNLNRNIKFIGGLKNKYIYSLLKSANIIVIPYTNTETSGVLNQALLINVPIIASNIGGLKETLEGVGVLVPPKNSLMIAEELKKLLGDRDYYASVQKKYKKLIKDINAKVVIGKTIKNYKNILSYGY